MSVSNCGTSAGNISSKVCNIDYGQIETFWLDQAGSGISVANAKVQSNWTDKINADDDERMLILPRPDNIVAELDDDVFGESNLPGTRFVREGEQRFFMHYEKLSNCRMEKLRSLHNKTFYAYLVTINGDIFADGDGGTTLIPVECKVFVKRLKWSENKDDANKTIVGIYMQKTEDIWNQEIDSSDMDFTANNLEGIIDFDMTEVSASATSLVIDFTRDCDDTEITPEFVIADFSIAGDGSLDSVSWSGNRLTFETTGLANDDVVTFKDQPDATTTGYEQTASLTVSAIS
jgi:hypothetical protein